VSGIGSSINANPNDGHRRLVNMILDMSESLEMEAQEEQEDERRVGNYHHNLG
jgi:hypothetical protein